MLLTLIGICRNIEELRKKQTRSLPVPDRALFCICREVCAYSSQQEDISSVIIATSLTRNDPAISFVLISAVGLAEY